MEEYILCIDDDEDDCALLKDAVMEHHPAVGLVFKQPGSEATEFLQHAILKQQLPAVIIFDINMQTLGGKEILENIQTLLVDYPTPMYLFTSSYHENDLSFAADHHIIILKKPTTVAGYSEIVNTILNVHE